MLTSKAVTARAHTNIALVKYWGKANEKLILPKSSSLSLTLDRFYTDTTVQFDSTLKSDQLLLNQQPTPVSKKVESVMNLVRKLAHQAEFAKITSFNHVPTAAGLASSASGLAALALAASQAAGLKLSSRALSRLARHGSGSASRSIYGGWVEWQKGHDDQSSYAVPLKNVELEPIAMLALIIKKTPKKISSRVGMRRCVKTSPYYPAWERITDQNLIDAKKALYHNDFTALGKIAETNAMRMHALTLSANPPFSYFNGKTIQIINAVQKLRENGLECYYTIDAGPNVKIMCRKNDTQKIKKDLEQEIQDAKIITATTGPAAHLL